jgi:hypothetical protein
MALRPLEPKSSASASSATLARFDYNRRRRRFSEDHTRISPPRHGGFRRAATAASRGRRRTATCRSAGRRFSIAATRCVNRRALRTRPPTTLPPIPRSVQRPAPGTRATACRGRLRCSAIRPAERLRSLSESERRPLPAPPTAGASRQSRQEPCFRLRRTSPAETPGRRGSIGTRGPELPFAAPAGRATAGRGR